jgi:hypothetical protein
MKGMKGVIYVWLSILITIFVLMFCYLVFTDVLYNNVRPIVNTGVGNITTNYTPGAHDTLILLDVVWAYWPLILIFGLLIFGFIAAQRREPNEDYASY